MKDKDNVEVRVWELVVGNTEMDQENLPVEQIGRGKPFPGVGSSNSLAVISGGWEASAAESF